MRYMIIVKATDESEAEISPVGEDALLIEMVNYHEQLSKVGVLLDGSGLKPSAQGWLSITTATSARSSMDRLCKG